MTTYDTHEYKNMYFLFFFFSLSILSLFLFFFFFSLVQSIRQGMECQSM
jgi:hypothetical protein